MSATLNCESCGESYDTGNAEHHCDPQDIAEMQEYRLAEMREELEETIDRLAVIENAMGLSDAKPSVIEEEDDSECWHVGAVNNVFDLLVDGESGTVFATTDTGTVCRITVQYEEAKKA